MSLSELIVTIRNNDVIRKCFPVKANIDKVCECLEDINNMVGMVKAKQYICSRIKMLLLAPEEKTCLHVLLTGNPGTGKTTLARKLGELFVALGLIAESTALPEQNTKRNDIERVEKMHKDIIMYKNLFKELQYDINGIFSVLPTKKKYRGKKLSASTHKTIRDSVNNMDYLLQQINTNDSPPISTCKFRIYTAADLVSCYVGDSHGKCKKMLDIARGGVVLLDEIYSLGIKDRHSEQSLTCINEYMSLYSDELVFIFSGYKDKIEDTLFKIQPGLKSRFGWVIHIDDYETQELGEIFISHLNGDWKLSETFDLFSWLTVNRHLCTDNGRSIVYMIQQLKQLYCENKFNSISTSTNDYILTSDLFDTYRVMFSPSTPLLSTTYNYMYA